MFGAPRLRTGAAEAHFRRRQPLAILSVLALHDRPVTRDELCYLFWSDAPQEVSRQRLRRSLSELRQALGPLAHQLIDELGTTGRLVRINPQTCRVDARDFLELTSRARRSPDPDGLRAAEQAVSISNEPLLNGLELDDAPEFEHWLRQQREHFQHLRLDALRRMVRGYAKMQDYARAIATVEQALALDALSEDLHRQAIWLYAASGRRSDAVRQFAWCASLLERELAIEPDDLTRAVYQAVLEGRIAQAQALAFRADLEHALDAAAWVVSLSAEEASPKPQPEWLRLETIAPRTLETEAALAHDILERVRGRGGILWVSGPAGVGKNALVARALEAAQQLQPGLRAWSVSARGGDHDAPFGLIRLLLDTALRERLVAASTDAAPEAPQADLWMSEAVRLLPELRAAFLYLPPPDARHLHEDAAPAILSRRLFQALPRALASLAGSQPTVMVLNDLDAADPASVEAVGWLARKLAAAPIAIVVTCRDTPHPPVCTLMRDLQAAHLLHTFDLPGLDRVAVDRLVARWNLAPALAEVIWAQTHGAPRAVLEMLRAGLALNAAGKTDLPKSLREAIQINLTTLDPVSRQVLEAAAVLNGGDTAYWLQLVSGCSAEEVERACDALIQREWFAPVGDRYIMTSPEVQQVVLDRLSPARRQRLHRQAAMLLRQHDAEPHLVAHHLEAAGQPNPAATMWLQAARRAREIYAYDAALHAVRRGLALARDAQLQFDLLCEQEQALHESGRREQQANALAGLQELANTTPGHPEWQAEAHYRRGRYALTRNDWDEAIDALQRAAACTLCNDDRVLIALGRALAQRQRWPEAESALQRALTLAQDQNDSYAQAQVWLSHAEIEQGRERYDAAEAALERAIAAAGPRSSLLPQIMLTRGNLASARNDFAAALTYGQEAQRLFAQRGAPDAEAAAQVLIARMCARLGRLSEALEAYQAAYAGYAALDLRQGMAAARVNASTLALRMGNFTHGIVLAREAYGLFQAIQDARGLCVAASNLGAAYVWLGEGATGEPWLRESYERAVALNLPAQQAAALANLGAALLQQGHLDEARARMEQGLALRAAQGHLDTSIDRAFLAIACLRLGDLAAADAYSTQALADLERMPQVENPQQVWFARAQVLRTLGRAAESRAALEHAVAHLRRAEAALPDFQRERYRSAFAFNRAILRAADEDLWPDPPALA